MQRKPKFWVLGDIFPSAYVVKYDFGRYETSSGRYLGLIDLATLPNTRLQREGRAQSALVANLAFLVPKNAGFFCDIMPFLEKYKSLCRFLALFDVD